MNRDAAPEHYIAWTCPDCGAVVKGGDHACSAAIDVEFVENLPECRSDKWRQVRATLAGRAGEWAKIDAKGGYPKARLVELGCEVRMIGGVLYARWPS